MPVTRVTGRTGSGRAFPSSVSTAAFFDLLGPVAQAFSTFLALGIAFVMSPILAILTKGKYYIARAPHYHAGTHHDTVACSACGFEFEKEDMACCPHNKGAICSLCCSLDTTCKDMCKTAIAGVAVATEPSICH